MRRSSLTALLTFVAVASFIGAPAAALTLTVAGPERVLFDQVRDGCERWDIPDAPARAFRDAAGKIVLFAPNFDNRAFVGPSLDKLARDCDVRFEAGGKANPALLDDRSWLHAFYTKDGRDVFALASASFIPYRHKIACAAGTATTDCWYNGLAALQSSDGGETFHYLGAPPDQLVFPPPEAYRDDVADPPGFMTATNIIEWKGALYTIVYRRGAGGDDPSRNCLARADSDNPLALGALERHARSCRPRRFAMAPGMSTRPPARPSVRRTRSAGSSSPRRTTLSSPSFSTARRAARKPATASTTSPRGTSSRGPRRGSFIPSRFAPMSREQTPLGRLILRSSIRAVRIGTSVRPARPPTCCSYASSRTRGARQSTGR